MSFLVGFSTLWLGILILCQLLLNLIVIILGTKGVSAVTKSVSVMTKHSNAVGTLEIYNVISTMQWRLRFAMLTGVAFVACTSTQHPIRCILFIIFLILNSLGNISFSDVRNKYTMHTYCCTPPILSVSMRIILLCLIWDSSCAYVGAVSLWGCTAWYGIHCLHLRVSPKLGIFEVWSLLATGKKN